MADRRVWWGAGVVVAGIGAALLTGAGTAAAEGDTGSDGPQSKTTSAEHDTSGSASDSPTHHSPQRAPKATRSDSSPTSTVSASDTSPKPKATDADSSPTTTKVDAAGDQPNAVSIRTAEKTADKPQTGTKRQRTPPRIVVLRITKPADTEVTRATADPVEQPTTKPTTIEAVTEPANTPSAAVGEISKPSQPDVSPVSTSDPTGLPRGPTASHPAATPTLVQVEATTTLAAVEDQAVKTVSRLLAEPSATESLAEPTTTLVDSSQTVDPLTVDPLTVDPTDLPAEPMTARFASMQMQAAPTLFTAAAVTTTPVTPIVIQAPPTVGPIARAVLDILASFGWRASPLAVAIFPALTPWSGAPIPTPIPAVLDPPGTIAPTTAPYVLVGHSTLDIPCGPGYAARTDWYFPAQQADGTGVNPQGIIYLQNGFLANSGFYSALATNLAASTNSIVVVPTITSNPFSCAGCWLNGASMQQAAANLFVGNRDALLTSAQAAGYVGASLPDPFILSGHSAGGGFAAAMASYTVDNGAASNLRGVVMFDGVPPLGLMYGVVPKLNALGIPIYQIAAQNQIWNLWGGGTNELDIANAGRFTGVVIYHGSHVDSMLGGNPIVDFFAQLVTQFSPPGATQAVYTFADGWINDMYAGSPTPGPLYPAPNEAVQVGPATAYGLPSPTGQRSRLGELIYGIISFFSSLFGA